MVTTNCPSERDPPASGRVLVDEAEVEWLVEGARLTVHPTEWLVGGGRRCLQRLSFAAAGLEDLCGGAPISEGH